MCTWTMIEFELKLKDIDGIMQNLYSLWRKPSVLLGKMDGRLLLLMEAGPLSLSTPYWLLRLAQKSWQNFEFISCWRRRVIYSWPRWLCSSIDLCLTSWVECTRYSSFSLCGPEPYFCPICTLMQHSFHSFEVCCRSIYPWILPV